MSEPTRPSPRDDKLPPSVASRLLEEAYRAPYTGNGGNGGPKLHIPWVVDRDLCWAAEQTREHHGKLLDKNLDNIPENHREWCGICLRAWEPTDGTPEVKSDA